MTHWDWIALGVFAVCWLLYEPVLHGVSRKTGAITKDMTVIRKAWMLAMERRDIRLVDSQLMGHAINSASFFGSANLILIAAVAGALFGGVAYRYHLRQGIADAGAHQIDNATEDVKQRRAAALVQGGRQAARGWPTAMGNTGTRACPLPARGRAGYAGGRLRKVNTAVVASRFLKRPVWTRTPRLR